VRARRFLILGIGSHISNVRIRQADNLARITRISENFLIAGEAGIKNNLSTAPGNGSRGTAIKNSPVFERKNSLSCFCFRQWILSLLAPLPNRRGACPYL
jgi:hypothetical protein